MTLTFLGCGKQAAPPTASSAPAPQAAATPAAPPAASPSQAAAATPPAAPVLATSDNENGTARVDVLELKRTAGDMLTLRVVISNIGRETLSTGNAFTNPDSADVYSVSGINLIDPINKKKYFVVRDSAGNCVCTVGLSDIKVGERIVTWARFPAPPEDVQKLSVMIPHFPPIDEIAIAK